MRGISRWWYFSQVDDRCCLIIAFSIGNIHRIYRMRDYLFFLQWYSYSYDGRWIFRCMNVFIYIKLCIFSSVIFGKFLVRINLCLYIQIISIKRWLPPISTFQINSAYFKSYIWIRAIESFAFFFFFFLIISVNWRSLF